MKPTKRQRRLYSAKVLALLLLAGGLVSALPAEEMVIDLSKLGTVHPGFRIYGAAHGDFMGRGVCGAGDVNCDGMADLVIGAPCVDPDNVYNAGEAYVVPGKRDGNAVDLSTPESRGMRIYGTDSETDLGWCVSGGGDLNGDGLTDVIVTTYRSGPPRAHRDGECFVVFGKQDGGRVDLTALGAGGFRISGTDPLDHFGSSVSGAGDVNGDGLTDLIVGAPGADPRGDSAAGESYVIFGKTDTETVVPKDLGSHGFRIDGNRPYDMSGHSVSGAGDVNGDGLADVIVGSSSTDPTDPEYAGVAFIVFGKRDGAPVNLASLGTGGFRIYSDNPSDGVGYAVSGAGDVNGDGLADVVVGVPGGGSRGEPGTGDVYVVFGKGDSADVNVRALGDRGFSILGVDEHEGLGWRVSGAGDFNGDGRGDLILGANLDYATADRRGDQAYLILGKSDTESVDVAALGIGGYHIPSIEAFDLFSWSVSGGGDVNGDGLADLVVSAPGADPEGRVSAGEAYVIFSPGTLSPEAFYSATALPGDSPRIPIGICGDGSNDSTPDSRCWIDFQGGSGPGLNGSSMQTVELIRSNDSIIRLGGTADVLWHVETNRSDPAAAVTFRYLDSDIHPSRESDLKLYHSGNPEGPWEPVTEGFFLDTDRNQIGGTVSSLGCFAIQVNPTVSQSEFTETPEGWTFAIPTPPFSSSMEGTHSVASGALLSTTHDNGNSFGFWESPLISLSPISVGEDVLYRATYTVSSDLEDSSMAPTMRLRLTSSDQQRTDIITTTSMGTASFSPGIAPRDYTVLHFGPEEQMRLAFDMLSFDSQDAANATLALHGVRLELLNLDSYEQEGDSIVVDPLADARAWSTGYDGTGAIAAPAEFLASEQGILIRGESFAVTQEAPVYTQPVIFGFWTTTLTTPAAKDDLYRVRWMIGSDATSPDAVPTFRLRVNDASLQFGSLVVIDSRTATAHVPVTGQDETYDQWFLLPPEVAGNDWLLSFDYLYADTSTNDDPATGLWLRRVDIARYR